MSQKVIDSNPTVQVYSPTLIAQALVCTIRSSPSGSYLIRTIPRNEFNTGTGKALLDSLSDAVESILSEGLATAAAGVQGIDGAGLIYDAVLFTVTYVPPDGVPGEIVGSVEIPVAVITADLSLLGGSGTESAPQLIRDEYDRLAALSG